MVTFLKAICRYTIVKNDSDDSEDETVQNDLLKEHVKVVDAFDEILNELENVRIALPKSQYTLRKESKVLKRNSVSKIINTLQKYRKQSKKAQLFLNCSFLNRKLLFK